MSLCCCYCCSVQPGSTAATTLTLLRPRLTQKYLLIFMPAIPAVILYQLQIRYLQNQNIIWPQVVTGLAVNLINIPVNVILMYGLRLGVEGSACASTVSQFGISGFLFIYIVVKKLHGPTWGGWSVDCLQDWGSFMRLAIPSMLMVCLEWWSFEIGGFLAGDMPSYQNDYSFVDQQAPGAVVTPDLKMWNHDTELHPISQENALPGAINPVKEVLSTKQLILRRGLGIDRSCGSSYNWGHG
ncbi:multidrug and toxin extrusion protein 1-like [Gastrophryne carolinensis]